MYNKIMTVKDEHIDFQGIMDGLYYAYYMEIARHQYLIDVHDIDIVKASKDDGHNYVLASIDKMNFKRPVLRGAVVTVSCQIEPITSTKFGFYQTMLVGDKIVADAHFTATCIPATGGRPFIPEKLKKSLESLR
jgi:acyl-CoA thioester hydrolase